ncbi:MAG: hypothetical protein ABI790_17785 [Betaproteobacteria bacterium]
MKVGSKLGANSREGIACRAKGDKRIAIAAIQQFPTYVSSEKAADGAGQRIDPPRNSG